MELWSGFSIVDAVGLRKHGLPIDGGAVKNLEGQNAEVIG